MIPHRRIKVIEKPRQAQRARQAMPGSAAPPMSPSQRLIHRLLCLVILAVVFEGVARKLAPHALGTVIFFLKDILTVVLLWSCLRMPPNVASSHLLGVMGNLVLLLLPCVLLTAIHDPLLAAFGLKQYALFPAIAVAMCQAYVPFHRREMFALFRMIAFSVVLTTLVAVVQNKLPSASWLNLSVTGDDLSGFAAGGYLRVSSTFPFVGQYCFYLNALCYCLPAYFYFRRLFTTRAEKMQMIVLAGLFIIGMFVTGSRESVIGNASILGLGVLLSVYLVGIKALFKVLMFGAIAAVLLVAIRSQHPEFFGAYDVRAAGTEELSQRTELQQRIKSGLLDWTSGGQNAPPSLFGYGLGVMSNGSEKLSNYAATWRSNTYWTETDQATTFFEGGWYLIVVWYGFRLWVVIYCFRIGLKLRRSESRFFVCFVLGYIMVMGLMGTLAIQPPLAIWWWLAVGLVTCLFHFDRVQPTGRRSIYAAI
jgi:hypothetical protein